MKKPSSTDFLLEIGTEELPASYVPLALQELKQALHRRLQEHRLSVAETQIITGGAPRRLMVLVKNLPARQQPLVREIVGPSKQAAFDANGQPTKACEGFLRTHRATTKQLITKETPKGAYIALQVAAPVETAERVLAHILPAALQAIAFPKTMRWDATGVRFARPVRWLLSLYGSRPVAVRFGTLKSGRITWGLRRQPQSARIGSPDGYLRQLQRWGIVLDPAARHAQIRRLINQRAAAQQGIVAPEAEEKGLLDEITQLVEVPVVMLGRFDKNHVDLPEPVLLASMAKYQRVIAIRHKKTGALLPFFAAVLNGRPAKPAQVQQHYEHVLNARLRDSRQFFEQDRRVPLEQQAGRLNGIIFHHKLGTMAEKAERIQALCRFLAGSLGLPAQEERHLLRAAQLAKADLVTAMVREFPSLQGEMGAWYAKLAGEPAEVVAALQRQYRPRPAQGRLAAADLLTIADQLDTLTGYLGIGIRPTGTEDPYGLRRAANLLMDILLTSRCALSLSPVIDETIKGWGRRLSVEAAALKRQVLEYLRERLAAALAGEPYDLARAVLASTDDNFADIPDRLEALKALRRTQPAQFEQARVVVERTANILRGSRTPPPERVETDRLTEPLEQKLWTLYNTHKDTIAGHLSRRAYGEATAAYGEMFAQPLHEFFDQVLVNVEDAAVRANRLALMRAINRLYTERLADLSHVLPPPSTTAKGAPHETRLGNRRG